jgi:GLPGLI family protein
MALLVVILHITVTKINELRFLINFNDLSSYLKNLEYMKNLEKHFLLFLLLLPFFSLSQSYEIDYITKKTINRNTESKEEIPDFLKKEVEDIFIKIENTDEYSKLVYNKGISRYKLFEVKEFGETIEDKNTSRTVVYKNFIKNECVMTGDLLKEGEIVKEGLSDLYTWTYAQDTMTIHSFVCKKATCMYNGKTFTAWYTPQILIMDGLMQFSGLPGLILKLEYPGGYTVFDKMTIITQPNQTISIPKGEKEITFKDYMKRIAKGF